MRDDFIGSFRPFTLLYDETNDRWKCKGRTCGDWLSVVYSTEVAESAAELAFILEPGKKKNVRAPQSRHEMTGAAQL